jgi:hypothetical protein
MQVVTALCDHACGMFFLMSCIFFGVPEKNSAGKLQFLVVEVLDCLGTGDV